MVDREPSGEWLKAGLSNVQCEDLDLDHRGSRDAVAALIGLHNASLGVVESREGGCIGHKVEATEAGCIADGEGCCVHGCRWLLQFKRSVECMGTILTQLARSGSALSPVHCPDLSPISAFPLPCSSPLAPRIYSNTLMSTFFTTQGTWPEIAKAEKTSIAMRIHRNIYIS